MVKGHNAQYQLVLSDVQSLKTEGGHYARATVSRSEHSSACVFITGRSGGLLLIFAEKPLVVRILLRPPEGEVSTLFLSTLKEMGGMVLMLGILMGFASRNPVRNVAVVDALIAGLCILALTPLLSLWMTDIQSIYPGYLLWGRSAVRFAVAALLYWLRPRHVHWDLSGISEESFGGREGRGPA